MLVRGTGQAGTIGGGALEWAAVAAARRLLAEGGAWARAELRLPLGPALGQCCGGAVRLLLERFDAGTLPAAGAPFLRPLASGLPPATEPDLAARRLARMARDGRVAGPVLSGGWIVEPMARSPAPLWLYGAGHVGRALVRVLEGLPVAVTWVDDAPSRFPDPVPPHVRALPTPQPERAAALAPPDALHLVMTYSHAADLAICHAILSRPHRFLGLIGSASKAARFRSRLAALGHGAEALARMQCPIGDRSLGKAPASIALGVAVEVLRLAAATPARAEGAA
jgi:xanthine dehydrogenase accessory factor